MKNFYKGMNVNNTIAYMVEKLDKYYNLFDLHEEVTGDNKAAAIAERHYLLCKNIINWLLTKNHTLVCQHCGSVHNVRLTADLRHFYTLCDKCEGR
jgi:hypothetical protein